MRLLSKGRSALIAMLDVAAHEADGPVPMPATCKRTGICLSYLEWIYRMLCRRGILLGVRGPNGGFLLVRGPQGTTVAEIVTAVEVDQLRVDAAGGPDPVIDDLWRELNQRILGHLSTVSLQDLVQRRRADRTLKNGASLDARADGRREVPDDRTSSDN